MRTYQSSEDPHSRWRCVLRVFAFLFTVGIGLLAAAAIACGSGGDDGGSSNGSGAAQPTSVPAAAQPVQEITLKAFERGEEYLFDQKALKVKPGPVKITLVNDGPDRPHAIDVKTKTGDGSLAKVERVEVGQRATIEFTVSEEGTYNFLCTIRGHADRGMTGVLTVSRT
jgi:plastocyanin